MTQPYAPLKVESRYMSIDKCDSKFYGAKTGRGLPGGRWIF
jgi:hypothetical protein